MAKRGGAVRSRKPTTEWESKLGYPGRIIVGVDEVGRGSLAGPVVAGALVLSTDCTPKWVRKIRDSKLLLPEAREELAPLIRSWAMFHAIGSASVEEIDRLNIHHASHLAMVRAVEALGVPPAFVIIDGKFTPKGTSWSSVAIVKGDQKCLSIAAASIIAKVHRDRLMSELDQAHPGYGFGVHKGYSTPAHLAALEKLGPCPAHRRSFAPCAEKGEGAQLSLGALGQHPSGSAAFES